MPYHDALWTSNCTGTRPLGSGNSAGRTPEILAGWGAGDGSVAVGSSRPRWRVRIEGPASLRCRPRSRTQSMTAAARSSSWSTRPQSSADLLVV